jgi:hypothetical protein
MYFLAYQISFHFQIAKIAVTTSTAEKYPLMNVTPVSNIESIEKNCSLQAP